MDPKRQARLIKTIAINMIVSLIFIGVGVFYVLPNYTEIETKKEELKKVHESLGTLSVAWVKSAEYETLVSRYEGIKFTKESKADPEALSQALTKPAGADGDYATWVNTELASVASLDKENDNNLSIIGSIIPTFSNVRSTQGEVFEKNRITLKSLVAYIEEDLLKKNGLESFSPVGMSNIVFPQTSGISHIGSYKIPLDIKGTNLALSNLIDQIQNSGRITIKDGKLVRTSSTSSPSTNDLSDLDNLLITIDSASFALPLDRSVVENKVTITLVFYVRGRNLSDYIEYRNRLALKVREIKTGVESAAQECKNPDISLCKNGKVFSAVNAIKNLSDDIKNLDLKMTELSKSSTVNDLSTEFNTLIQLSANTSTIETAFNSYKTVINTIKWDTLASSKTPAK